jgi:hypothetical protein
MKPTFVLKNSDNSLFPWPQVRFDAHKAWALRFPLRHVPFEQRHQWEEHIVPVFDDIWPLMAIHVDPLPHPHVPPSKGDQPLLRRALQQTVFDGEPERWEDLFGEGMMEFSGGHFACWHTQQISPRCRLHSLIFQQGSAGSATSSFFWQLFK